MKIVILEQIWIGDLRKKRADTTRDYVDLVG